MTQAVQIFKLLDRPTFGRNSFAGPYKHSEELVNEARFVFVRNGQSSYYSPEQSMQLETGDCLIMKCERFVNSWGVNDDGSNNEIIGIIFYPDVLKFIYDDHLPALFFNTPKEKSPALVKFKPNAELLHLMNDILFYFEHPKNIKDELIKVKIRELIYLLVNNDPTGEIKHILGSLFQTAEHQFKEVIRNNLFRDLGLEDLAFLNGMSLSTFKRKFKELYDTSPRQYIKHKRLSRAKELLEQNQLTISEVAYDSGFNDTAYFTKSFSAEFGMSPREYRNQL